LPWQTMKAFAYSRVHSTRAPSGAQELVRTTRDALPAGEFAALRAATLRLMEARSRTMAEDGATRCLYCIHIVLNMAGARAPRPRRLRTLVAHKAGFKHGA